MSEQDRNTAQAPESPPLQLDVSVRPIEPKGNLLGFASLKINDRFVVDGFKILDSDKGLYVGMPSVKDERSRSGYRDTAKPITAEFRKELTEAVVGEYHAEVEQVQARAAAIAAPRRDSIHKQLDEGARQAAKDNAARPAPDKADKAKGAER